MSFIEELNRTLSEYELLKHPYYQAWNAGKLTRKNLQAYAAQYYPHVEAFPRYVSAIHSRCENLKDRQVLLENLIDEERGTENHPELWLRFAEGVGAKRADALKAPRLTQTQQLLDTYDQLTRSSYGEGLSALYAYERQIPEISQVKIHGLKQFYGVTDKSGLSFFAVHQKADVYHSQACATLLENLPESEKPKAKAAAVKAAKALWKFLDGVAEGCPCGGGDVPHHRQC